MRLHTMCVLLECASKMEFESSSMGSWARAADDRDDVLAFALNIIGSSLAQKGFEIFAIDNEYILITREKLN